MAIMKWRAEYSHPLMINAHIKPFASEHGNSTHGGEAKNLEEVAIADKFEGK